MRPLGAVFSPLLETLPYLDLDRNLTRGAHCSAVCLVVECGGGGTADECVSLMKNQQFETVAMTISAAEASAIIAMKYPDLSEGFPMPEVIICTPPPPTQLRRKRPHSPHTPKRMNLADHFNQMADMSMTILYPSSYSTDDYREEDAFLPYLSPLKAEHMSSFLRVRALSTPTKKSKRASPSPLDSAKRFRTHQTTYHSPVGLKRKILRLCGASKSPHSKKYISIPGKAKLGIIGSLQCDGRSTNC